MGLVPKGLWLLTILTCLTGLVIAGAIVGLATILVNLK